MMVVMVVERDVESAMHCVFFQTKLYAKDATPNGNTMVKLIKLYNRVNKTRLRGGGVVGLAVWSLKKSAGSMARTIAV